MPGALVAQCRELWPRAAFNYYKNNRMDIRAVVRVQAGDFAAVTYEAPWCIPTRASPAADPSEGRALPGAR